MADLICRWRNPYVKTIVELVKVLPHEVMPSDEYRTIIEKRWPGFLRTAYQLACQVGLYYESDDGFYYPRFYHDIEEDEANAYMQNWIRKYYVPNPYTKSMTSLQHPQPFLASIIGYIYEHPEEKELHSILENVFQEDIGNIDIISNVLNTYTDLMNVDSSGNIELTVKAKDFMKQYNDRNDKKAFFDNFSEDVTETSQEEKLRQISAATFLKKALSIVIEEDPNLSKLEALGIYKETSKQLKINGFYLWRKKDDLPLRLDDVHQDLEIEYEGQAYVMYLEWTPASMEEQFFPVFNRAYNGMFKMEKDGNEYVLYKLSQFRKDSKPNGPLQQIFYGAPGTGKSHEVDRIIKKEMLSHIDSDEEKENHIFRTTFHPESDYSSFVGCYKPRRLKAKSKAPLNLSIDDLANILKSYYEEESTGKVVGLQKFCFEYSMYLDGSYKAVNYTDLLNRAGIPDTYSREIQKYINYNKLLPKQDDNEITYDFTAQAFTNAYVAAWQNPSEKYFLVIEELSRGNCAAIFGDIFQLLDRDEENNYISKYKIEPDADLKDYLEGKLGSDHNGIKDGLRLPGNLYIWATMNTSDKSIFPMDSAFKRRWRWRYQKISYGTCNESANYTFAVAGKERKWVSFLAKINKAIKDKTDSEDKQMGDFFIKGKIDEETFIDKVMFYLWSEIGKENFKTNDALFLYKDENGNEKDFSFNELNENGKSEMLLNFMKLLDEKYPNLPKIIEDEPDNDGANATE